jgi:hypothetical protein
MGAEANRHARQAFDLHRQNSFMLPQTLKTPRSPYSTITRTLREAPGRSASRA